MERLGGRRRTAGIRRRAHRHQDRRRPRWPRPASSPRCSAARAGSSRPRDVARRPRPRRDAAGAGQPGVRRAARWSTALLDEPGVELHAKWAPNIVTALGRLRRPHRRRHRQQPAAPGRLPGLVSAPRRRPGSCGCATRSACRWSCSSTSPATCPALGQEWDGVVRRGAKLLHAFAEAVVPRVTLVTRKAYGGAYIAMNSRSLGATAVFAWPDAEVAVMGASAAVNILHRRKLAAAPAGGARGAARAAGRGADPGRRRRRPGAGARRGRRGDQARARPGAGSPRPSPPHRPGAARTATSRS